MSPSADTSPTAATSPGDDAIASPGAAARPTRATAARRELAAAVVGCLLGATLVLFSGGATWVSGTVVAATAGDAVAPLDVDLGGSDLAPAASALGLAGLAAVVAVVATRRVGRTLTGVLLVAVGGGILLLAGRVLVDPASAVRASSVIADVAPAGAAAFPDLSRTAGGWVCALGGLLLALSGVLVTARGARWPTMSGRYERHAPVPADAWEAIERGEDPT